METEHTTVDPWKAFAAAVQVSKAFDEVPTPIAPNYNNVDCWAAHPAKKTKVSFVPDGINKVSQNDLVADVFYVHPTSFFANNQWNAQISDAGCNRVVDEILIPGQASIFNSNCTVYAPRYRQATFCSFLNPNMESRKALELAYSDIKTAFQFFIKNLNDGRPFFIAGHSQGALHLTRLLEEEIDDSKTATRLIAAYIVGFLFPLKKAKALKNIHIGTHSKDTQCLLSWDTFLEGFEPKLMDNREHWYQGKWKKVSGNPVVGVNPISWKNDTKTADAHLNKGGVTVVLKDFTLGLMDMSGASQMKFEATHLTNVVKNIVSARCNSLGILQISEPEDELFKKLVLPINNYHNYDYALFHMNIRQNIRDRLQHYMNTNNQNINSSSN